MIQMPICGRIVVVPSHPLVLTGEEIQESVEVVVFGGVGVVALVLPAPRQPNAKS